MFKSKFNLSNMETTIASTTIIAAGTTINGDIKSEGDIRIDGTLNGNLTANAKIFIGAEGMVKGNINAVHADIFGKVKGNLKIKELLQLLGKCDVEGDIFASKLQKAVFGEADLFFFKISTSNFSTQRKCSKFSTLNFTIFNEFFPLFINNQNFWLL